jgi:hypothetical protein
VEVELLVVFLTIFLLLNPSLILKGNLWSLPHRIHLSGGFFKDAAFNVNNLGRKSMRLNLDHAAGKIYGDGKIVYFSAVIAMNSFIMVE